MTEGNQQRVVAAAAAAGLLLLSGCASDPYRDSLRPTVEDRAKTPEPPPAGTVAVLMRIGEATRRAGNPAGAIPFFRRAHAADIFKPEPLIQLGLALNDMGAYNEAAEAFREALKNDPHSADAMHGFGVTLIALDQPALAIDQLNAAVAIEPNAGTYNALGVAYDHLGDYASAQKAYNEGLKLAPNSQRLLNNLGLSLALAGDLDKAIETLLRAALDPGASPRLRQNLALVYGLAGRDADAARVARTDLSDGEVQRNLAYYGMLRHADKETVRAAVLGLSTSNGASNAPGAAATRVTKDESAAPADTAKADSSAASSTESAATDDGTAKPQGVSETAPKVAAPAAVAQAAPPVSALPSPAPKPEMIARETRHAPAETAPPKVTAPKITPKVAQVQSVIPIVTAPPAQRPQASTTAGRAPTEAADEVTAAVGQPTPLLRAPAPPVPSHTFAETATSEPAASEPASSETAQVQTVIPIVTALTEPPAEAFPAPSPSAQSAAPVKQASSKRASSKAAPSEIAQVQTVIPIVTALAEPPAEAFPAPSAPTQSTAPVRHASSKRASEKAAPSQTAQVQTVIPIVTALAEPPADVPSIPAPPAMLDEPADHPAAEHARSKIALAEGLVPPVGALAESPAELPPIPAPPAESEPTVEQAAVVPLPPKTPAAPETPHLQTVIPVVTAPAEPAVELPSFPVPAESKPVVRHAAVAPLPAKTPAPSETAPVQTVIPIVTALAEQPTQALVPASGPEVGEPRSSAEPGVAEDQESSTLTGYSDEAADAPAAAATRTSEGSGPITSVKIVGKQVYVTRATSGSPAAPATDSAAAPGAEVPPLQPASGAAPDAETTAPAQETTLALSAPLPADTAPASEPTPSDDSKQPAEANMATPSPATLESTPAVGSSMQEPSPATDTGAATAGGGYYVQLAAVRTEAATATEWQRLRRLHRDLLAGLSLNVVKTDLGDRGVFYRIQAGALSEAAAHDLCAEILKTNAQCFVVKP